MTLAITVIKVIGRWIVEVHRQLDKAQPEDAGVEIDVGLWIARDCGHVMNTRNAVPQSVCSFVKTLSWAVGRVTIPAA